MVEQPMRFTCLLGTLMIALGCQYDPHAHLYTTEKPSVEVLIGSYKLTRQTVIKVEMPDLLKNECSVELRSDGSFSATNLPPWVDGFPSTNFFSTLLSGSGKWRVDSVGSIDHGGPPLKTHWGIYFDGVSNKLEPAGLTGSNSPYGLVFTIGDPDSGQAMFFEKAK